MNNINSLKGIFKGQNSKKTRKNPVNTRFTGFLNTEKEGFEPSRRENDLHP